MRPLNHAGIRYIITGSVAAIFYGEPRLTHDVDFVVVLNDADIERLAEAFPAAEFYLPLPETIAAETQREQGGHFNIIPRERGVIGKFRARKLSLDKSIVGGAIRWQESM
ncbi:MAG: hypothetical protein ACR2OZ_12375 [Verrucomicrobiales bacterium]